MARKPEQTASPARNFTLTTDERVRALVTGPPAWARRLKRIEDLRAQIVASHRAGKPAREVEKMVAETVELVRLHNRYYPVEANLPLDAESRLIDQGEPWKPMPVPTLESLLEAAAREGEPPMSSSLAWSIEPDALVARFDSEGERFTLRLDEEALSCSSSVGLVARVPTWSIEEFAGGEFLEVVTRDTETVRLPFVVDAATNASLAAELALHLREMRSATSPYRGDEP